MRPNATVSVFVVKSEKRIVSLRIFRHVDVYGVMLVSQWSVTGSCELHDRWRPLVWVLHGSAHLRPQTTVQRCIHSNQIGTDVHFL